MPGFRGIFSLEIQGKSGFWPDRMWINHKLLIYNILNGIMRHLF